jgi:hypothetical protein
MKIVLAITLMLMSGCAAFNKNVAPKIADGIKQYCVEPQATRLAIRSEVNALITPNSIKVECVGDTPAK